MKVAVSIDIVSDVVCPWCYIGKRRLERALAQRPEVNATIRWVPYYLDANVPQQGITRLEYISRKFGTSDKITPMHQRLVGLGARVGLDFRFEKIERQPHTRDAHRLIAWAQEAGKANPVVDRLFAMFFTEGADLTKRHVLAEAGKAAGLDPDELLRDLESDKDKTLIDRQAAAASASGIGGVPFFVFDKKVAISGAQEIEIFTATIDRVLGRDTAQAQAAGY
ncbi:MAG: DsbA family oxidoreductase [Bradyrhizobiaceae bacterium]|nr:DsbA family oxidoreductase [Bradyrhizobiaceae bacterium]